MNRLRLLAAVLVSLPALAGAHGGLPVARDLLWSGDTMYVPTPYWGVFVGPPGGPFRWLCEEVINTHQQRRIGLGGDGTLYASDRLGLDLSRDGGCSWQEAPAPLDALVVAGFAAAPDRPSRMLVAAAATAEAAGGGLYVTEDQGRTFAALLPLEGRVPAGVVVSADGRTVVTTARARQAPLDPRVYVSRDGGATFQSFPITHEVDGDVTLTLIPRGVDPRDGALYLSWDGGPVNVLLRSTDGGATLTELLRVDKPVEGVAVDEARGQLVVATARGLYAATGAAALAPLGPLSRAQCVSAHGGALYACSWNWEPDAKAIGRSDDGGATFARIFQFHDTASPIECPAGTPGATTCQDMWRRYADQLGIDLEARDAGPAAGSADGGAAGAAGAPLRQGGGCAGAPGAPTPALLFALLLVLRRRR